MVGYVALGVLLADIGYGVYYAEQEGIFNIRSFLHRQKHANRDKDDSVTDDLMIEREQEERKRREKEERGL